MRYGNKRISEGAIFSVLILIASLPLSVYALVDAIAIDVGENKVLTHKEREDMQKAKRDKK